MSKNDRLTLAFETGLIDMPSGKTLVLRATPKPFYKTIENLVAVQTFKPLHDVLIDMGIHAQTETPNNADVVIIELTRSKDESLGLIARALDILPSGGLLIVDGDKTDGIESVLKSLRKFYTTDGVFSKSHGKTIWLRATDTVDPALQAWSKSLEACKNNDGFFTTAGMFSHSHIDVGSELLVEHLPKILSGKGADLGAGWGWLSTKALETCEKITSLDMVEAEQTALSCASQNNPDPRAKAHWSDITAFDTKADYNFVIMNPPFHQERKADPEMGRQFIKKSAQMLGNRGTLWMVANKQLAYETQLTEAFTTWEYIAQTSQFKVIRADRPKTNKVARR